MSTYISVDLEDHEIFRSKVGKGGIKESIMTVRMGYKNVPRITDRQMVDAGTLFSISS